MRTAWIRRIAVLPLFLMLGCAGPGEEVRRAPDIDAPPAITAEGVPATAFELLARAADDSCAICARQSRDEAFAILEERYRPATILSSEEDALFALAPGGENELLGDSYPAEAPRVTFRFHTAERHLVGIAPSDWTDEGIARVVLDAPAGARFRGALETIPFAYGDGATFLYNAAANHLQIQCRIVEIELEEAPADR